MDKDYVVLEKYTRELLEKYDGIDAARKKLSKQKIMVENDIRLIRLLQSDMRDLEG